MPAFYPRSTASQLPLTPPDSGSSGYGYSNMHFPQGLYHNGLPHPRQEGAYDYQQDFVPAMAAAQSTYPYQQSGYQATATSLPPISSYYEPIGAPILPPLRMQDRPSFGEGYQRRIQQEQQQQQQQQQLQAQQQQQQQQRQTVAKEEKATGGVSAKLDYEMERMTDFVSSSTQQIFQQNVTSPPAFRKWVHQVLSATRLPSATILLSLHYLNDRMRVHPDSVPVGENQLYRLLAVALILGSKFLDDNTFINRSWSDVTSIKVTELNTLELKWLRLISYNLHVQPEDGVQSWIDAWKKFDTEQVKQLSQPRLSPLDTTVNRHGRDHRYSPYPSPYSSAASRHYEAPNSARSSQYSSTPYSAQAAWGHGERSAYDDFYKRGSRFPTLTDIDDANRRASEDRLRQSMYDYQSAGHASYYQPAAYGSAWDQYGWSGVHRSDCTCSSCAYQHNYRPYPMASSYAPQTVMG